MSNDSNYITILCGRFDDNYAPLTRSEFWKLYHRYGDSIEGIVESGEERITELLKRSAAVTFTVEKLQQMGLRITTFADDDFPAELYRKLKDFCPPLLYCCGDASINDCRFAGYVGSRTVGINDIEWTERMVEKNIRQGFAIVTGGAKGIDHAALAYALNHGGKVVAFLPDNMKTRLRDSVYQQNIIDGNLLIYSHVSPLEKSGKNTFVAAAMERNKFIYALSAATAVVKADLNKGGSWSGATEALRHGWTRVFVWDNKNYAGNQKLIELGAVPLSDNGEHAEKAGTEVKESARNVGEQISLYELI